MRRLPPERGVASGSPSNFRNAEPSTTKTNNTRFPCKPEQRNPQGEVASKRVHSAFSILIDPKTSDSGLVKPSTCGRSVIPFGRLAVLHFLIHIAFVQSGATRWRRAKRARQARSQLIQE